jgi:hypothetical protein
MVKSGRNKNRANFFPGEIFFVLVILKEFASAND